jgi:hypothetical protein
VLISFLMLGIDAKPVNIQPAIDPATGMPLPPRAEVIPFAATLNLAGQYGNVKGFLGQIFKMDRFNDISSVSISKAEAITEEDQGIAGEIGNAVANTGMLQLKVVANFSYLPRTGVETYPDIYNQTISDFDWAAADDILNSNPVRIPDINAGAAGKTNPFLP